MNAAQVVVASDTIRLENKSASPGKAKTNNHCVQGAPGLYSCLNQ
jgi:hypothetical protein